jgi:hypothetical protein
MKKVIVPEGMLESAKETFIAGCVPSLPRALEAALRWLGENPIVPTDAQRAELGRICPYEDSGNGNVHSFIAVEWQRRMFLAPEPEIPKEIEDFMFYIGSGLHSDTQKGVDEVNQRILEAYRRGQQSRRDIGFPSRSAKPPAEVAAAEAPDWAAVGGQRTKEGK